MKQMAARKATARPRYHCSDKMYSWEECQGTGYRKSYKWQRKVWRFLQTSSQYKNRVGRSTNL